MKYLLLIHQGTTPTPRDASWNELSQDEQNAVYAAYKEINQNPGVTSGLALEPPELATTVRVEGGKTLTTDGPSTSSEARTAAASPAVSLTSVAVSLGNIAARPAPR